MPKQNDLLPTTLIPFVNYKERSLISSFTGMPIAEDPRKKKDPARFSDVIDRVWESWKIGTDVSPEQKISENWSKLVGVQLANKCAPERLDPIKGYLIIRCSSSTVKQELTFKKKLLVKKISGLDPSFEISDIKIH